jgi:PAS domain S-box-containing protein
MLNLRLTKINYRVSIAMICVVAAIVLGFAVILMIENLQSLERELEGRASIISRLTEKSLSIPMWNIDDHTLNDFMEALFTDHTIVYAEYQVAGNITLTGLHNVKTRPAFAQKPWTFFEQSSQFLTRSVKVFYQEEPIGSVRFAISRVSIQADIRRRIITIGIETIVVIIGISLTSIAITTHSIIRPLQMLQTSADHLAQGQLDQPIDTSRRDELGHLAHSFVNMRDAIREKIVALNQVNADLSQEITERKRIETELRRHQDHLEDLVRDRTAELTETNAKLQQDIAERKRAEEALQESEQRYRLLIENIPTVVWMTGQDGRTVFISSNVEKVYGYSPEEILTKGEEIWFGRIHAEDLDHVKAVFGFLFSEQRPVDIEYRIQRKDGQWIWLQDRANIIEEKEGQLYAYGVFSDITERKRAEEALQQAKEAAEAANQAKSIFLANMSHELRTPLNVILGFTQILARLNHTSEEHEHLAIIQRSGEHLLNLINQVLDLSKIEAGQMTLSEHTVDLYDLLEDMQDLFSLKAQYKGLQLLVDHTDDVPRYVRIDEIKLRQVLINLLNNAIKFTEQGTVSLHVARGSLNDGRLPSAKHQQCASNQQSSIVNLQFSVTDTGPGIAPEERGKVFETFVQTETGRQTQEGTGLGLAISRKFVQLMGGDITVNSEVGRGTTFTIVIQCQSTDALATPHTPMVKRVIAIAPAQPRYRLLVVDDKPDNRALFVTLLNPLGFDLREAENGQEAIGIWTHWNPHLIWMDLRMPVIDGYEATKRIRNEELSMKHEEFKTVIIAVTASSFEEEQRSVLSAGCDALLRKPFREAEVFEILHKHLGVEFVYAEDEGQKAKGEGRRGTDMVTPGDLAVLSSELLKKLEYAAITTNVVQLTSLIRGFQAQHPGLANALMQMVDNFEYPTLLAIIEATLKTC